MDFQALGYPLAKGGLQLIAAFIKGRFVIFVQNTRSPKAAGGRRLAGFVRSKCARKGSRFFVCYFLADAKLGKL